MSTRIPQLLLSLLVLLFSPISVSAVSKTSIVDAGKRATVADLERLLSKYGRRAESATTSLGEAKPDTSVSESRDRMEAVEIEFRVLTERLTPWTRERLENTYRLGPEAFDALERVADLSAFQTPPANEIAPDPPLDASAQERVFKLALSAGLDALRKLPQYSLKIITEYYNNGYRLRTDQNMVSDMIRIYKHKWQGIGPWTSTFSVQEGQESPSRNGGVSLPGRLPKPPNLESWGEFGAQPALILSDITTENLHFLRWERSPRGQLAVFHYEVAAANSHYRVDASCGKNIPFHSLPPYQGTLSIDSKTGAILRLTMEATAQKKDPVFDVAAAIDYGPVRLGEEEANLPLRSLTFMTEDPNVCLRTEGGIELASGGIIMVDYLPTRRYNRVLFTDYQPADIVETQTFPEATTDTQQILNLAQKRTSVAELDRLLDKLIRESQEELPKHAPESKRDFHTSMADEHIAQSISELELTERLDTPHLKSLKQQYHLGSQSFAALELLADLSALREPVSVELVKKPAPSEDAQKRMLQSARDTSLAELGHLPNFFARRDTVNFAGEVQGVISLKASASLKITFRDGREVIDKPSQTHVKSDADSANSEGPSEIDLARVIGKGLISWGEFGSELMTVLSDTQLGSIHFWHWEDSPTGLVAVFHFDVPQTASHYQVSSDCGKDGPFHVVPAYKGTLALELETSRVVRLQVETDFQPTDPIFGIASVVEYAPVQIGEKWFNRPQRSLAFLTVDLDACITASTETRRRQANAPHYLLVRQLNRTTFSDYHRLGSTFRILPEASNPPGAE